MDCEFIETWGAWKRHCGGGMTVSNGTVVEVITLEPTGDRIFQRVGVAGTDLTVSWDWTPETRDTHPAAPIDFYRIRLTWWRGAPKRSAETTLDREVA